jgi:putative tricarboxylic transport membrane protein
MKKLSGSSLLLLLFSCFICIQSYRLNLGTLNSPGPGLFPFGAGLILGLLALIVILQSAREDGPERIEGRGNLKIVWVLFALVAYGLVLERFGFLVTTFGLLVFLLKVIVSQRWGRVLISALLSTLTSYVIFQIWLKAQLPKGFIGF